MNRRIWNAFVIGAVFFLLDPLAASTNPAPSNMRWPELLQSDAAPADPHVAALQQRANEALGRLLSQADLPG